MRKISEDIVFRELKSLGVKVPKTKRFTSKDRKQEKYPEYSACKVFGLPLSDQKKILLSDLLLPKFIVEATSYLTNFAKEIGLFRKTGSITRQRQLRIKLDHGGRIEECNPNDIASLLKQWLRELPEPLIPVYLHDLFLRSQSVEDDTSKITAILLCCYLLPKDHLHTLKHLMHFFSDVASNSDTNKMGISNLAVIMAPNIFVIQKDSIAKSRGNTVQQHAAIIEVLISNADKIGDFPSAYLEECDALKCSDHLDMSIEISACTPSQCKKKQGDGPVQDLFSGIRKLVVRRNSTSPNSSRKNQDNKSSASRSAAKRRADLNSEQMSSVPKKKANILQDESLNCTPTGKKISRRGDSCRKTFGFLRKRDKRQKSSKLPEAKDKDALDTPNTPSAFQEKFFLAFEEPVKGEISSSKGFLPLSPLDIDGRLPKQPSGSDFSYLSPRDEEFKDLPFRMYSPSRYMSDQKNKSSFTKLRDSNESKQNIIKCKSDGLKNEMEFFTQENNSNYVLQFACNENFRVSSLLSKKETPKRHSLSPVNIEGNDITNVTHDWNSGSPILKDCYVALCKAKIPKPNFEVLQKEIISGSINRICNDSNAVANQYSNLIQNSYNNSLDIPQVLNGDNIEVYKTNLYFKKDRSKVMDKLDVPSLWDNNQRPFLNTEIATNDCSTESLNNAKVASKDISAFNTKLEKTVNENQSTSRFAEETVNASASDCPSAMNTQKKKVARKCSLARQEAFRIKPRASKKSADSIIVSNTKMKISAELEINQSMNSNLMPSDMCNHFSAESNVSASMTLSSSTTSIDSSVIFQMENITLVSPNTNPAVQTTIDELENTMLQSKLLNACVSDRNAVPKRKFRAKHCYSDSKIYKSRKSTRITRTNSFPNPKTQKCKNKNLRPPKSFSPKCISTTNALDKENSFLSSSINEISEINMKTPSGNTSTQETWVSGGKFFDSQLAEEEVFSKRESISRILKNNPGHVQAKVHLYDDKIRNKTTTPASVKATRSGATYDSSYSNSRGRVSQRKQSSSVKNSKANYRNGNSTSKNGIKNLPPPPKFIIPDSPPQSCHSLKEVTNISSTDEYFSHSLAKNSLNHSFKDKSPQQSIKSTLAIKSRRNSYCGHTPYKLSRIRSECSLPFA